MSKSMQSRKRTQKKSASKLPVAAKNTFRLAIEKVDDIKSAYRNGLQALVKADLEKIKVKEARKIEGSVDIDTSTRKLYPNDARWDYVISYAGLAYFVEVHPATNGEVKTMMAKKQWLQNWLKQKATTLNEYPSAKPRFYWLQSGKCGILKTSPEYKLAAMAGILPRAGLSLG